MSIRILTSDPPPGLETTRRDRPVPRRACPRRTTRRRAFRAKPGRTLPEETLNRPSVRVLALPSGLRSALARVVRRREPGRHRRPALWHPFATREFAAIVVFIAILLVVFGPEAAFAVNNIPTVINNTRNWLMGILTALAILFLTIGGVRYLMAGGDPGEVEKAKTAFKAAAIGFCLAVLAPVILAVLQGIVGGPGPTTGPEAPKPEPTPTSVVAMGSSRPVLA
ncbi:pilin [Embleya sp. NPDC008237]|uniref:pilin n=1 Tax=Embleya sp. NPDC008237 TaxID=3363978 RepID=UPI0036EA32DD